MQWNQNLLSCCSKPVWNVYWFNPFILSGFVIIEWECVILYILKKMWDFIVIQSPCYGIKTKYMDAVKNKIITCILQLPSTFIVGIKFWYANRSSSCHRKCMLQGNSVININVYYIFLLYLIHDILGFLKLTLSKVQFV